MQVAVDLSPIVNQVLAPIIATVLSVLAGWVLTKVGAFLHIQVQDSWRTVVSNAIDNGIALAQKKLAPGEVVHTDAMVAQVLEYVMPKVPDALKGLGVTPDHLADVVKAKLPA